MVTANIFVNYEKKLQIVFILKGAQEFTLIKQAKLKLKISMTSLKITR